MTRSRDKTNADGEPQDRCLPMCATWSSNGPCTCWVEEVGLYTRLRPDPGPDPNAHIEAVELPCDQDMNEAS